jgi:hypothetical protein
MIDNRKIGINLKKIPRTARNCMKRKIYWPIAKPVRLLSYTNGMHSFVPGHARLKKLTQKYREISPSTLLTFARPDLSQTLVRRCGVWAPDWVERLSAKVVQGFTSMVPLAVV